MQVKFDNYLISISCLKNFLKNENKRNKRKSKK